MDGGGRILSALGSVSAARQLHQGLPGLRGSADTADVGGLVLPRYLRRPARWWSRVIEGGSRPPRFAATLLSSGLLASSALYGAYVGNHFPAAMEWAASHSGFAVENIRVTGNARVSEIDVVGILGLDGSTSLLRFAVDDARERIAALPWVESVSVRKSYPATLEIALVERQPFAIWQSGSQLSLIDRNGDVIVPLPGREFVNLPLVIGYGAPQRAENIVALSAMHPELASRIKAFIRVGDRRWDLRFDNGVTVRLPDGEEASALVELASMERSERILSRDIVSIDLRASDRVAIGLTPEAAVRRAALVAERGKKKPGRGI